MEIQLHAFLTSALDGEEWSASHPGRFTSREKAPGTTWIEAWVGPRVVLDAVVKRKIPSPPGIRTLEPNPDRPARSLVAILTKISWLLKEACDSVILQHSHWKGYIRGTIQAHWNYSRSRKGKTLYDAFPIQTSNKDIFHRHWFSALL
jgi:hypothetical protein